MGNKLTGYGDWDQTQVYIYKKALEGTDFCGEDSDYEKYCSLQQMFEKGEK